MPENGPSRDEGSTEREATAEAAPGGTDRGDDAKRPEGGDGSDRTEGKAGGSTATGTGSSPMAMVDDLPVSRGVLGGVLYVVVTYVTLGFALGFTGFVLINLFGGANLEFGGKRAVGLTSVTFLTLAGPVLAAPLGLWLQRDADDGPLVEVPAAFVSNALGGFIMLLFASIFLAAGAPLQLVDLIIPFLFAAFFTGLVAAITTGLGGLVR